MNRTKKLISSFVAAAVLGLGAAAQAQESTPPPTEPAATPPPAHHSSSSAGEAGIGVGVAASLTGSAPLGNGGYFPMGQFVYDTSLFHVEGLFGFASQPIAMTGDHLSVWQFGAGGWYHFHKGASADFSLGGALIVHYTSAPMSSATLTSFEPGAMIRGFVTPNLAVSARAGLMILLGDTAPGNGANFYLGGQPSIVAGLTYFFR